MTAIGYACFRDNLELFMDKVSDECETVTVAMENNKNVVVLSEESYNNLMENLHVMGSEANYSWLMASKNSLKRAGPPRMSSPERAENKAFTFPDICVPDSGKPWQNF